MQPSPSPALLVLVLLVLLVLLLLPLFPDYPPAWRRRVNFPTKIIYCTFQVSKWRLQFKEAEARLAELAGDKGGDVKRLIWGVADEERFRGELDEKVGWAPASLADGVFLESRFLVLPFSRDFMVAFFLGDGGGGVEPAPAVLVRAFLLSLRLLEHLHGYSTLRAGVLFCFLYVVVCWYCPYRRFCNTSPVFFVLSSL